MSQVRSRDGGWRVERGVIAVVVDFAVVDGMMFVGMYASSMCMRRGMDGWSFWGRRLPRDDSFIFCGEIGAVRFY